VNQTTVFAAGEGDAWFRRNASQLAREPGHDEILSVVRSVGLKPKRVLEVGAANGYRLSQIKAEWGSECWGLDVSQEALQDGQKRFPAIQLLRGVAHQLPFPGSGRFDLVIVNFVFHWIDRMHLLQSVAEIDRVLLDGGFLAVGDFYPDSPTRRSYHHLPGQDVWTYKQDYPGLFLASHRYRLVSLVTGHHANPAERLQADSDNRIETAILKKELTAGYSTG